MKILLLGEYSGFHYHLARGLRKLGHNVSVAGQRDGGKKIPVDVDLDTKIVGVRGKFQKVLKSAKFSLLDSEEYDIVQVINPVVFPDIRWLNEFLIPHVLKRGRKTFLSACGVDSVYLRTVGENLRYNPIEGWLQQDLQEKRYKWSDAGYNRWNEKLVRSVSGVIPIAYDYWVGYSPYSNCHQVIPLPVDLELFPATENVIKNKIVFLHGANRPGFKGTAYIKEAFANMLAQYPSDLEFITPDSLPLPQYLELLKRANVIVDQATSYSCGMNALFSLASGRVVMGGAEPESLSCIGISKTPVVNIVPDVKQIEQKIRYLLDRRSELPDIGLKGREFVEKVHDAKKVAEQYLAVWAAS